MIECEHLFCYEAATARVTVPHLKPRQFVCEEHLAEVLKWAAPHRYLGAKIIEAVGAADTAEGE